MTFARRMAVIAALLVPAGAIAQDMPGAVLELKFTPAPRAQIAVWLEHGDGRFIRTLALTEAVAFRGIGNRPGASQMNSGYRWPYGRREGVLPIWGSRRAAAQGAAPFNRVIFQDRSSEGAASRTTNDQSVDSYYCLSFNADTTRQDALDAVSCASVFASDKGRFITQADVDVGYAEPWQDPGSGTGSHVPLPLHSLYPPRMDVMRCTSPECYDHADVALYPQHARAVMPEIDAVSMATLPGFTEHSMLFSLPPNWPSGSYAIWIEVNVEGDYNPTYDATTYATPTQPSQAAWDSWAMDYGYPYRGQPSLAFTLPFELGDAGVATVTAESPMGRSSWDVWSHDYGALESLSGMTDDHENAQGSGADRLVQSGAGARVTLSIDTLVPLPEPDPDDPELPDLMGPGSSTDPDGDATEEPAGSGGDPDEQPGPGDDTTEPDPDAAPTEPDEDGSVIITTPDASIDGPVGPVRGLELGRHPDVLHSHEWITLSFVAVTSEERLHRYEVRVSTDPVVDEDGFIRHGRPAKTASLDSEGAVSLMLPAGTRAGERVAGELGNLVAQTHYWIAVRAVDRLNRQGPISVAQVTTTKRTFATVTPCFIASAAYGTQLANEVRVLRRARDRYLMSHALGRSLVALYYTHGARLAAPLRASQALRSGIRGLLTPVVALARLLESDG